MNAPCPDFPLLAGATSIHGIAGVCFRRIGKFTFTDSPARVRPRLFCGAVSSSERFVEGVSMVFLTNLLLGLFLVLFSYALVCARTRRQLLALCLAGALAVALFAPPSAQGQGSLVVAIESVLNAINGLVKTALGSINSVQTAVSNFYQQATWPVALISQAKGAITEMIDHYRGLMQTIFNIDLKSATLANPAALETVMRNHQTADFASLTSSFGSTYGALPAAAAVSPADRTMMDMDDALAVDNLKTFKESDAAVDLTLQAADSIENAASQAAPGSAPFLTATGVVASIQSQALTQKMFAAELRQEAAKLAHENALRKRGATATGDVNTQILNLLQRK